MRLTGAQKEALDSALRDAYRDYDSLERMLLFKLDRRLADITGEAGLKVVVFRLIASAESEGWLDELATGALLGNPNNDRLRSLYDSGVVALGPLVRGTLGGDRDQTAAGLLPYASAFADAPPTQVLESLLQRTMGFVDVIPWATKLVENASQVCLIRIQTRTGEVSGTGFLVKPGLVLTNYHVVCPLLEGDAATRDDVEIWFDFANVAPGSKMTVTKYTLAAQDWLVCAAPPSPADLQFQPGQLPLPGELDFGLLRLDGSPGSDPVLGRPQRGWFDLTASRPALEPGLPLVILQHPKGLPLRAAFDTEGVIDQNANRTRVSYRTNTLPGSSGSPCLSFRQELVAVHHAGEPDFGAGRNEGVPIEAIVSHLDNRGGI